MVTVEANDPAGGTVTPSGYVSKGMTVTIDAVPNEGYVLESWLQVTPNPPYMKYIWTEEKSSYTFEVTSNVNFRANFRIEGVSAI